MLRLSRAAFSRDDVEDAKRGAPDFDLRAYANDRDLEFLDHRTPAGFRAALPCDAELQSNVLRGVLPGGAHGVLAHEGLQVGWSSETADWGGTYYGVRVEVGGGLKGLLPFVGPPTTGVARVPCTIAASPVPETVAVQPYLRIDTRRSAPPYVATHRVPIADLVGQKDWSVWSDPAADPDLIGALVAEPVAELLRTHSEDGLFQAVVWWGTLIVRRNGYLRSDHGLDELGRATSLIARRLREVCRTRCRPQPFDATLPPPRYEQVRDPRELPPGFMPGERIRTWSREFANRHHLELEDPPSLHSALPSLPIPGAAMIVMRGNIPHVGPGRLVVSRERDAMRPAVLTTTLSGTGPTQPGGEQLTSRDIGLRHQIADGVASVWSTNSYTGTALADALDPFLVAVGDVLSG